MTSKHNVGTADAVIRIALGFIAVLFILYNYLVVSMVSVFIVILLASLAFILFKSGITKHCPLLELMGISSNRE